MRQVHQIRPLLLLHQARGILNEADFANIRLELAELVVPGWWVATLDRRQPNLVQRLRAQFDIHRPANRLKVTLAVSFGTGNLLVPAAGVSAA